MLSFFPRGVLDEILNLIESVSEEFPSYSSNALGENFQKNSSRSNYSQQFQDIKVEKERDNLNFQSRSNEKYNLPFKLSELKIPLTNLMIQLQARTIFTIKF